VNWGAAAGLEPVAITPGLTEELLYITDTNDNVIVVENNVANTLSLDGGTLSSIAAIERDGAYNDIVWTADSGVGAGKIVGKEQVIGLGLPGVGQDIGYGILRSNKDVPPVPVPPTPPSGTSELYDYISNDSHPARRYDAVIDFEEVGVSTKPFVGYTYKTYADLNDNEDDINITQQPFDPYWWTYEGKVDDAPDGWMYLAPRTQLTFPNNIYGSPTWYIIILIWSKRDFGDYTISGTPNEDGYRWTRISPQAAGPEHQVYPGEVVVCPARSDKIGERLQVTVA
jgi:hypothetical protein